MNVRALLGCVILAALAMGAVGARAPQAVAPTPASGPKIELSPAEIELYRGAQTLIDWTPSEIAHSPYLHKLRPTENQDQLPLILDRVGQAVALTFHNFRNVSCDEKIDSDAYRMSSVRARRDNYAANARVSRWFHYIIVRRAKGDLPAFTEYRTDLRGNTVDLASDDASGLHMLTWNFTATFLFLSPVDQHIDRYRYLGVQTIRNRECHVVGFAQDPRNVCRPNHFYTENTDHVVLLQGMAWIDTQTFEILRVITMLQAPRKDIGLDSQTTTVNFFPVRPLGTDTVLWLPRDVRVETVYRGIKLRNVHQYSNFKFFRVESTIMDVHSTIRP